MADKIEGHLEVGATERREVEIFLPPETVQGFSTEIGGHIVFSINQARHLAACLLKQASIAADEESA